MIIYLALYKLDKVANQFKKNCLYSVITSIDSDLIK